MLKVLNILIPQQFHLKTKVLLLFLFYSSVELFIYESVKIDSMNENKEETEMIQMKLLEISRTLSKTLSEKNMTTELINKVNVFRPMFHYYDIAFPIDK